MRIWLVSVLAGAFLAAATVSSAQEIRIGTINLQKALNESTAGAEAKKVFKVQLDRLQKGLEQQKNEVDSLKDQIAKKALVMKDDERRNLEKEYQRKLREFERAYEDSQAELQAKDAEMTRTLLKKLQAVIQDYGRRGGYTVILEQAGGALLYGADHIDVTDAIIVEFNQKR